MHRLCKARFLYVKVICLDKLFVIRWYLGYILGIILTVATGGMYVLICKYGIVCVSFFAHLQPPQRRPASSCGLFNIVSAEAANLVNGKQIYMSDAMRGKLPPSSRKESQTGLEGRRELPHATSDVERGDVSHDEFKINFVTSYIDVTWYRFYINLTSSERKEPSFAAVFFRSVSRLLSCFQTPFRARSS